MKRNDRSNALIKWVVIIGDFLALSIIIIAFAFWHPRMMEWNTAQIRLFMLISNVAMLISQWRYHTIIHENVVSGGDVLRRIVYLVITQTVAAYLLMKIVDLRIPVGWLLVEQGAICLVVITLKRLLERTAVKAYRQQGGNTRTVTFVGSDPAIDRLYQCLLNDPTTGYRMIRHYESTDLPELIANLEHHEELNVGDEMYVCLPARERDTIRRLSLYCDQHFVKFYCVPMSIEFIQLDFTREFISDIEVYTTHESLLRKPINKLLKRVVDIIAAIIGLVFTGLITPIVYLIVKAQSQGPLFFTQLRTGLDGQTFTIYKFRSMHVNSEADKLQATKNDVRKFPFGTFMRKLNIDELPQLWNVLRGDMSIVGPRPHMIAHTEKYSQLIDKYMVRHFVKPGMTGWAQVSGYRGETKELWQMEERVKRDIWYMEHWSIWLDLRIIWLTVKNLFIKDEQAY